MFTVSTEDCGRHPEVELSKISQETLLMDRLTQDQAYPPDLLSFPLRGPQISPGTSQIQKESPIKSPGYAVTAANPAMYRIQAPYQSAPMINQKGYVTLPRRPRHDSLRPQVFSTLNGVIPYYDTFNMKLFGQNNYYSLNKSEMDLGPVGKSSYQDSDELEPAPSPAPGTPHATIPRNSLSSPNIHNQLLALQAMSNSSLRVSDQRPLKILLAESESILKTPRDLRINYSVNVVSGTLGRRTSKPTVKPKKRNSCEVKEQFLMTSENATQV